MSVSVPRDWGESYRFKVVDKEIGKGKTGTRDVKGGDTTGSHRKDRKTNGTTENGSSVKKYNLRKTSLLTTPKRETGV